MLEKYGYGMIPLTAIAQDTHGPLLGQKQLQMSCETSLSERIMPTVIALVLLKSN